MNSEISRTEARSEFDKRLAKYQQEIEIKKGVKPEPEPFQLSPALLSQMGVHVNPPIVKQDSQ